MYIYIYIYIYTHTHTHTHTYIYIYIYICMYISYLYFGGRHVSGDAYKALLRHYSGSIKAILRLRL
jgi:hypothetical protein